MKRKLRSVLIGLIAFIFSGCYTTIKVDKIKYSTQKGIYEYWPTKRQSIVLRDESGTLISEENIDLLMNNLEENNNRYPFPKRLERSNYIGNSDQLLTSAYSHISTQISENKYDSALADVENLFRLYPDVFKYSDVLFLKGYSFEQLHLTDSARHCYSEFLKYSESKYSDRFRGYRDADENDSLYLIQRNYATEYLIGNNPEITKSVFTELSPNYYFSSFNPGFTLNPEDIVKGSIGMIHIGLGYSFYNNFVFSIQTYHKLTDHFDINPMIFTSGDSWGINLALPTKLYKSTDNRFGLKLSPFVNYTGIDSLSTGGEKYNVEQGVFSGGAKLSAGLYLTQKFSLGAYYTFHINNQNNPVLLTNPDLLIWRNNAYDVSLYYNILKTFGLKTGIRNGGIVAGIFLSGWEVGFDFTHSEFVLQIEMY